MPKSKDTWHLSVNYHLAGQTYRSLTQALMTGRYYACETLMIAKIETALRGGTWYPVTVRIVKNGEVQSQDVIL
jgi:hypothetical protein